MSYDGNTPVPGKVSLPKSHVDKTCPRCGAGYRRQRLGFDNHEFNCGTITSQETVRDTNLCKLLVALDKLPKRPSEIKLLESNIRMGIP